MDRKKRYIGVAVAAILVAGAIFAFRRVSLSKGQTTVPTVAVVEATLGTTTQTVMAPGTIVPTKTTEVSMLPGFAGTVSAVHVKVGDRVSKGQILVTLDPREQIPVLNAALARERSAISQYELVLKPYRPEQLQEQRYLVSEDKRAVDEAQAHLDLLVHGNRPEQIRLAEKAVDQEVTMLKVKERENARDHSLFGKDLVSAAELQRSDADLAVERDKVSQAKDQLSIMVSGARVEEIQAARSTVEKMTEALKKDQEALKVLELGSRPEAIQAAREAVNEARAATSSQSLLLQHQYIRAPISGIVSERNVSVGEIATPPPSSPHSAESSPLAHNSEALFQIVDDDDLEFLANVDQLFFQSVHPGQYANVTVEALPGRDFQARVVRVQSIVSSEEKSAPGKASPSTPLTFLAWAKVSGKPGLVPGQTGVIIARRETKGIVIPQAAVSSFTIGQGTVFVVDRDVARRRVVTYEGNADTTVRILGGLASGEKVIVVCPQRVVHS